MTRLPTFSQLGPAIVCSGAAVLPRIDEVTPEIVRGRSRHRFIAAAINAGREAALGDAKPEHAEELARIDLPGLLEVFRHCGPVRAEVAFAVDPIAGTARELGQDIDRGYDAAGATEREICGTLDLYALVRDKPHAVLVDMKGPHAAGDPWQLRIQAVALRRKHGLERVFVAFAHARENGRWGWAHIRQFDEFDLDGFEVEIADAMARWQRAASAPVPDVCEGDHCGDCKSARYCPAKNALIRVAAAGELRLPQAVALLSPKEKADAWAVVRKYKPLMEQLDKALRAAAEEEPIDLGDRVVMQVPGNEVIDDEIAAGIVAELYGIGTAMMARGSVTKASLKRALGAAAADAVLERIRTAGGIRAGAPKVQEIAKPKGGPA
jgi:hypothetical protein